MEAVAGGITVREDEPASGIEFVDWVDGEVYFVEDRNQVNWVARQALTAVETLCWIRYVRFMVCAVKVDSIPAS